MALAAAGGQPIIPIGHANLNGTTSIAVSFGSSTIDAVNEACMMIGHVEWADSGTHTINTTGSSSIQWRSGSTVTFVNAGTTFKVGIAAVDTATGPPARAVNATNVITFDVAASFTGGSGITANAWQISVPTTGTLTIANGTVLAVCFQMTARGGTDSVQVSHASSPFVISRPSVTNYLGGTYTDGQRFPNVVLVASDGTLGFIYGGYVASTTGTSTTWNSGSATKEYGNILRVPFPVRAYGITCGVSFAGDCDLILYSSPLGSPVAERTISVDSNVVAAASSTTEGKYRFSSTFDLAANTDYAVIAKPTTVTSVTMNFKTFNDATHQAADFPGSACYAVNRAAGAFAAQNASKDRYPIGLLVGAFETGAGGGGRAVQVNADSLVGA